MLQSNTIQCNTTLLSLRREICLLARHLVIYIKHSINYNKTKFFKQQNIKIETLNRPQHIKKGVAGIENCAKYMCIVAIKVLKHVSAICV